MTRTEANIIETAKEVEDQHTPLTHPDLILDNPNNPTENWAHRNDQGDAHEQ